MESHGELIAIFVPALAAAASPEALPRLPSGAAGARLPPEEDFLTLLDKAAVPAHDESPVNAPIRQFLPTGGQTLPLPVALARWVDPGQPAPLPGQLAATPALPVGRPAGESVLPPTPADAPRAAGTERVETAPLLRGNDTRSPEVARIGTPPPISPGSPAAGPLAAPALGAAVAGREQSRGLPQVAKPQAKVDRTHHVKTQVDSGRHLDLPGERQIEANPLRFTPVPERFEATPLPSRPDIAPALPSSSPLATAPPNVATPLTATEFVAPPPANPVSPSIPAAFPEIVDSVRTLSDQNGGEMRLRLNPPELGHLDIKVSVKDEQTFVSIAANNSITREVLEQHIGRLRTLLDAAGLDLMGAEVSSERHPERRPDETPEWVTPLPRRDARDDAPVERSAQPSRGVDLFV